MSEENTLEKLEKNATKMSIIMEEGGETKNYGPFLSDSRLQPATLGSPSDDPKYSLFNTLWREFFRIILGAFVFALFIGNNNIIYLIKKKLKGDSTPEPSKEGNYSFCSEVPLLPEADNRNVCNNNLDYKKNNCDYVAPGIDDTTSVPIAESCDESKGTESERKTANFLILIMGSLLFVAELFNYYRMSKTPESEKGIKYKIVSTLSIIYTICLLWPILTSLCMIIDNTNEADCSTFMYIGIVIVVFLIVFIFNSSIGDGGKSAVTGIGSLASGTVGGVGKLAGGIADGLSFLRNTGKAGITGFAEKAKEQMGKS